MRSGGERRPCIVPDAAGVAEQFGRDDAAANARANPALQLEAAAAAPFVACGQYLVVVLLGVESFCVSREWLLRFPFC